MHLQLLYYNRFDKSGKNREGVERKRERQGREDKERKINKHKHMYAHTLHTLKLQDVNASSRQLLHSDPLLFPIRWLFEEMVDNQCAAMSFFLTRHILVCQKVSEPKKVVIDWVAEERCCSKFVHLETNSHAGVPRLEEARQRGEK